MIDLHIIRWSNIWRNFNVYGLYRQKGEVEPSEEDPTIYTPKAGELHWVWLDNYGSVKTANYYFPSATFKETDKLFEQYLVPFDEEDLL